MQSKSSHRATRENRADSNSGKLSQNVHSLIEQRAYELYEHRGRQDGYDLDDWLHAEREVLEPGLKE